MNIVDFWQVMLYILGSILLVVLIVLGVKTIFLMNKIENTVDNINIKLSKLDALFNIIEFSTERFNGIANGLVDAISSIVTKVLRKRKDDENE